MNDKEVPKQDQQQTQTKQVPTMEDVLKNWLTPTTNLTLQFKDIEFNNPTSAVKKLQVTVSSSRATEKSLLHRLNTRIRLARV